MDATWRTCCILYSFCKKNDLCAVASKIKHLTEEEQVMLNNILSKYKLPVDGTLGNWKTRLVGIKLQPDAKTYHVKLCLVPRSHRTSFKKKWKGFANYEGL